VSGEPIYGPECKVCSQGRLVYMTMEADGVVFFECEECMTGYRDVAVDEPKDWFRCEDLQSAYRPSTRSEVDHATAI